MVSHDGNHNSCHAQESEKQSSSQQPITSYNQTPDILLLTIHILNKLLQLGSYKPTLNHPVDSRSLIHQPTHFTQQ